ncbi:MAG: hypothetical protein NTV94_05690 [Planctomycetota bacterium]|nr:hypothetical protein [Planctomycetota bacterium]
MLHVPFKFGIALVLITLASVPAQAGGPNVEEQGAMTDQAVVGGSSGDLDETFVLTGPPSKPVAARSVDAQRPLGLPRNEPSQGAASGALKSGSSLPDWAWQLGALGLVIASILAIGALVRRVAPASGLMGALGARGRAPSGVLEVLGRYPVSRGSMLVLLKLDRRVLLVNQACGRGGTTMTTLTEITDPAEVAALVAKTGEGLPNGRQFERTLERVGGDAAAVVERPVIRQQPMARKKPVAPVADLDAAAVAQSLRSKLAAMQTANAAPVPSAATAVVREYSA